MPVNIISVVIIVVIIIILQLLCNLIIKYPITRRYNNVEQKGTW